VFSVENLNFHQFSQLLDFKFCLPSRNYLLQNGTSKEKGRKFRQLKPSNVENGLLLHRTWTVTSCTFIMGVTANIFVECSPETMAIMFIYFNASYEGVKIAEK
jgi:hypothetical protein